MAPARIRTFSPVSVGICCALIAAWSADLLGQESSNSDAAEDAAYRGFVKDALSEYDAHHYEEARSLFRRAHQINPNARTLRGIGIASFDLRDYVAAARALSDSLADTRKPLTPEQRVHAQGLLERCRSFIDVYTLKITPADARVLLDGRPPDFEPDGTVLIGLGTHNFEASKGGYVLRAFSLAVRGGERKELVVTLEAKMPDAKGAPVATGREAPLAMTRAPASRARTSWLIAAGGAGVLAAAAGAYWIFEAGQLNTCRNHPQGVLCDNEGAIKTDRNIAMAATLASGAAALTFAVIGILSGPSPAKVPQSRSLACGILPAGVSCSGRF
jgi:hypothetical protein